jgi:hypothetical protein
MQISMLKPGPYHAEETPVVGCLTNRHTIALTVPGGVVVLTLADVRKVLPQLTEFSVYGQPMDDD